MSAAGNFSQEQATLAQQMTSPLQAGQTQQQPVFNQPTIQSPGMGAHQQYQQMVSQERAKASVLAEAMRSKALDSAIQATKSGAMSANASKDLEQINAGGRIQAKHPLDLLAIGIRGWKANKAQKKSNAAAAKAQQDTLQAAQAAQISKEAREDERWLKRKEFNSQQPEDDEVTKNRAKSAYGMKVAAYQQANVPENEWTFNTLETYGRNAMAADEKSNREQGTGYPEKSSTDISKDVGAIEQGQRDFSQMVSTLDEYDPEYMGVGGLLEGTAGQVMDFFGAAPENATVEFMADREKFRGNLQAFANKLIKERSGAAVTKQEFDRFMQEYPLSKLKGQAGFESAMDGFVTRISKENYERIRTAGWVYDSDGSLIKDPDSKEAIVQGYKRNDKDFWKDYADPNAPEDLFDKSGDFVGFKKRGDKLRAERKEGGTGGYDPSKPSSKDNIPPVGTISPDGKLIATETGWEPR